MKRDSGETMSIKVEEAKKYKGYAKDEVKIARFLEKNKGNALTEEKIRDGIGKTDIPLVPDEKGSLLTLQNASSFTLNIVGRIFFSDTLNEMVKKGKISVSEVAGEKYYFIE